VNELKPCPFCGGPAYEWKEQVEKHYRDVWIYYVDCETCLARMCGDDPIKVVNDWNQRAQGVSE
jgi:Lar family restriction alleviation protein